MEPEVVTAFKSVKVAGVKKSSLRSRSKSRSKFMAEERSPKIRALVEAGFACEISPVLREAGVEMFGCTVGIQGFHERRKRSAGGSLRNPANLVPACNWCNGWLEDNPRVVREVCGDVLVVREGDREWSLLGSRTD